MNSYDSTLAPPAFGLNNTGAICYLNSFLQMMVGCTSLSRAILDNPDYMQKTKTGAAMLEYFQAATAPSPARIALLSSKVLVALRADLATRRPKVKFGSGQESASEALILILDMMEPPKSGQLTRVSHDSPTTSLFINRVRCALQCRECKSVTSKTEDYSVMMNLFHIDHLKTKVTTPKEFSDAIRTQISETNDFTCSKCRKKTNALRTYNLTMIPEIIVCSFNIYARNGVARTPRYFPLTLEFPATAGGTMLYKLVGQIEHSGSLAGGHYWARGLRKNGVFRLNDTSAAPSTFEPTRGTYIVAYHYDRNVE